MLLTQEIRTGGTLAAEAISGDSQLSLTTVDPARVCFTHPVQVHDQPSPCLLLQVLLDIEFGPVK